LDGERGEETSEERRRVSEGRVGTKQQEDRILEATVGNMH
jgi:hypothetical protein